MANKSILIGAIVLVLILGIIWYIGIQTTNDSSDYVVDEGDFVNGQELIQNIEPSSLSEDEISGLILMREEEKLARDVYLTLYDKWNLRIFNNIANSEQTHTDAVKVLLDRYDLEDPVKDDAVGVFTSLDLKTLYDELVSRGSASLLDALVVGATIEDLDIKDLNELLTQTDNEDIILTYNNLNRGSRNHLRAYVQQIESNGGSYSPQYISQSEYNSIISSDQERGR